jgi:hypothetical protein
MTICMWCGYQVCDKDSICPHCGQKLYPVEVADRPNLCGECVFYDMLNGYCTSKGSVTGKTTACDLFKIKGIDYEK